MSDPLFIASVALYVAGFGVIAGWFSRRGSLAAVDALPCDRMDRFGIEIVLVAVGGYLLAASACLKVAEYYYPGVAAVGPTFPAPAAGEADLADPVSATGDADPSPQHPVPTAGERQSAPPASGASPRGDPPASSVVPSGDSVASNPVEPADRPPTPTTLDFVVRLSAGNAAQLAGLIICLALAVYACTDGPAAFLIGARGSVGASLIVAVTTAAAAFPLCDGLAWLVEQLLTLLGRDDLSRHHAVISAIRSPECPLWGAWVLWAGAVAIAPAAEEAFFRGILQNSLRRSIGRAGAIVLTSLAFGIAHAGGQTQAVPALVALGVLLGWAYVRTGSLLAPVLAHALFNLKTLIWVAWGDG